MKKIILLLVVLATTFSCSNVENLHYGVKYNPCNSTLKMEDLSIIFGKWNTCGTCCEIAEFPTTPLTKSFTKDKTEDHPTNQEFTVPIGTSVVSFDYNLEFQIVSEEDAKKCFMSCKAGKDFDSYIEHNMKNNLRDVFKNVMREYKTPEALIDSTAKFEKECFIEIVKRLSLDGITVTRANLINNFRWPDNVAKTLNEIIAVKATTMKAEASSRAAELESKANIIKAEADAKVAVANARKDAEVALIKAESEAATIRKINSSLTPNYLRMLEIQNFTYKTELVTPQGVYKISQKEN